MVTEQTSADLPTFVALRIMWTSPMGNFTELVHHAYILQLTTSNFMKNHVDRMVDPTTTGLLEVEDTGG